MKPRNKFQKHVCEVQEQLPDLSPDVIQYAYDKCLPAYFVESRNRLFCLECGHKFVSPNPQKWMDDAHCECPSCGKDLKRINERNKIGGIYQTERLYRKDAHMAIVTVVDGMQLVRTIYVAKDMNKKKPAEYWYQEVSQHFMTEQGKVATFSKIPSYSYSGWAMHSPVVLRDCGPISTQNIAFIDCVYPKKKMLPVVKRNGFKTGFYGYHPHAFMYLLLTEPKFETLVKSGQRSLVNGFIREFRPIKEYWSSIRIAIRNGYIIKDASMWIDYMQLLQWFKKDIRNAKYVCPPDLKLAHDTLMKRREAIQEANRIRQKKEDAEEQARLLAEAKREYANWKGRFFDLEFTDGEITITPLKSVDEFEQEGKELAHCVYVNEYYRKEESLVLSAKVNGKRMETIEVSLKTFEIVQSRGFDNDPTDYNKRIVQLMEQNMSAIRRAHTKNIKRNDKKNHLKAAC